ncbi:MAG: alanyl-tRNA editing protein [Anaerolineae bacterium]|nr:alanyl-tRNA editing protein [Anaerolineae bacterium]
MTNRLYYNDSYLTHFKATVVEHVIWQGLPALILDQSALYPTSGGQPHDTGTLDELVVNDVVIREEDAALLHVLSVSDTPLPAIGSKVIGRVNWQRRFDHMQHHTGQHLLTQAFIQIANARTVSFHLSPDSVTIDLDVSTLNDAQVEAVESLANRIIYENRPITARLREIDDQESVRMRRLPKHIVTDGLRIIEIADFDVTACGGTHVAHTGEIGLIKVLRLEKRGGKMRVEFRCGGRALADYSDKHRVISTLAAELDCRYVETPTMLAKLRTELKTAQAALKDSRTQLIEFEAAKLLSEASSATAYRLIIASYEGRDPAELKLLASQLTLKEGTIALLGTAGDKAQFVFARSTDLPYDMGALLKSTVAVFGGRGGGQPTFAQGGGMPINMNTLQKALTEAAAQIE